MPSTPQDLQTGLDQFIADVAKYHAIIHGGPTATVVTEGGIVPSAAKAISDLAALISTGFAEGFVAVAANEAARLLTTPARVDQLLIQHDTHGIYYAPSTVMGSWVIHPVQASADDAAAALAGVTTLTALVASKMATADYVGDTAAGDVRTAKRVRAVADFANDHPEYALRTYGVEAGAVALFPACLPNGAGLLVDGLNQRTALANTSRRCLAPGTNFAILSRPRRLVSWGAQTKVGILGSGMSGPQSLFPRAVVARQQPDRNLPNFDPFGMNTVSGEVAQVCSQGAVTVVRTTDGLVLVAGAAAQGIYPLMGSGVDKNQNVLMPIYFNSGGENFQIKMMDVVDSTASSAHSTGIFVDTTENVWLLTTNPKNAGYGNSLTGAQTIPVKLNPGFPAWDAKIIKKVRCDTSGGIYILFTNGELWAGGGSNATGLLGIGTTANVANPLQVATAVDDFEVSGHGLDTTLALWILQGTTLKAAGYNAFGQLNQGNYVNRSSFVTVATDVNLVRMGGTDNVSLFWRTTTGTFYAVGHNTDGIFGENLTGQKNFTARLLVNLTTLVEANGGLVDLCISGYASKHSACVVCTNGLAFTCGNNTSGVLANGVTTAAKTWQRVNWSPIDGGEKIVDVSAAVGPDSGPAFTWRTNYGRVLQAGSVASGFATGVSPPAGTFNILSASPVQLSNIV